MRRFPAVLLVVAAVLLAGALQAAAVLPLTSIAPRAIAALGFEQKDVAEWSSAAPGSASEAPATSPPVAGPSLAWSDSGASVVSAEETFHNRRGLWSKDSSGRESRISKGPIPRLSALVPILMYHSVRPIDFKTTNAFVSSLTLPPSEFERQLIYLKGRGFSTVSMLDVAQHLRGMKSLPARPIVLTFDDGFENNYKHAFPLLKSYGYSGTFYIITGLVGRTEYMTWRQAGELARGGMEIGSHTINHPDLAHLPAASLDRELTESKRTLEDILAVTVTTLSYPSGAHSAQTVAAAARAGYASAVTTKYGAVQLGAKPFEMPRVRIQGTEELAAFRWKVEQYFPSGDPVKQ